MGSFIVSLARVFVRGRLGLCAVIFHPRAELSSLYMSVEKGKQHPLKGVQVNICCGQWGVITGGMEGVI